MNSQVKVHLKFLALIMSPVIHSASPQIAVQSHDPLCKDLWSLRENMSTSIVRRRKWIQEPSDILDQGSANYSSQAKNGPLPVFVIKVLLDHAHSLIYCLWLLLCYNCKVKYCHRNLMIFKALSYYLALYWISVPTPILDKDRTRFINNLVANST